MLQNSITVHSCIRRTKQSHFQRSESQIKTFFCFSPGRRAAVCSEAVSTVRKCTYEFDLRYLTRKP